MKKTTLLIFSIFLISFTFAGIPINQDIQLHIQEDFNTPVNYEIDINTSIYDSYTGGNLLYTQTESLTPNNNGYVTVTLKDINLPFREQYFLELKIGTETLNRINLTTNPYSFTSNYSFYSNNTENFDGYSRTGFKDWLENLFDTLYCKLTGCEMSGDIDMNNNDVLNVNNITANYFLGDGSQLENININETDPISIHKDGSVPLTSNWDAGNFNITAESFFSNFIGNLTSKITKIFTQDIEVSGKINLTNSTYNNQIYTNENGTLIIKSQNGETRFY